MGSRDIKVWVVNCDDRANYLLMWNDPLTGRRRSKSSGIKRDGAKKSRKEAERKAGELEAELREGRYKPASRITWREFRDRYTSQVFPRLALATRVKYDASFNAVERLVRVERLSQLTADRIEQLQALLRAEDLRPTSDSKATGRRSEASITAILVHLKSSLRWARSVGMLDADPVVRLPKRGNTKSKGRPVLTEEFERMLERTGSVVGNDQSPEWQRLLEGLWWSGLRLEEAISLSWDDAASVHIDLTGKFPAMVFPAPVNKSRKEQRVPIAPEFVDLLELTPREDRTGKVFRLIGRNGQPASAEVVTRTISRIGEAAGIRVGEPQAKTSKACKFASAHDLRRSFGFRWAQRVNTATLMLMMRHQSVTTTMSFYVSRNCDDAAQIIWLAPKSTGLLNTLLNTDQDAENPSFSKSLMRKEVIK